MGSSTGPQAPLFASKVPGAGPERSLKPAGSDVAWGHIGQEGEDRTQPRSLSGRAQAGWLQTQHRVSYRYRARREVLEGDVMENIYTARSVHPWLLFGGDFEHRSAEVSHTLLHVRSWGKQALPLAGKAKKHKWKFSCLRQSDCWRLGAHCQGKQPALAQKGMHL